MAQDTDTSAIKAPAFYFLSDLHLGGEGLKENFVCEEELLGFLGEVQSVPGAVIVLLGDLFDFWQLDGTPAENLRHVRDKFPRLFETFKELSASHRVLLFAGNHDREAHYAEAVQAKLREYGIHTLKADSLRAELTDDGHTRLRIYAEHGHQADPYNTYEYPDQFAETPFGEHLMRLFINPLKQMATESKTPWLSDVDNVIPLAALPFWLMSKYFYHEAGFWLKVLILPCAILFGLTKIALILLILQAVGVNVAQYGIPYIPRPVLIALLGFLGLDLSIILLLVFLWVLRRDALKTLKRWGVRDLDSILRQRANAAERRAARILEESGDDLYVFGHTHARLLKSLPNGKAWANTGTWIRRMHRVAAWFHLPPVFVPVHEPTYVRVTPHEQGARVELRVRGKPFRPSLAWLERLAILGRKRPKPSDQKDALLEQILVRPSGERQETS